jgi:gliding motility-associated-like protein
VHKYGWLNNCENTYFDSHNVCKGDSLQINGNYYHPPTIVIDSFVDVIGCDSIWINSLILKQLPNASLGVDTSFCEGDTITLTVFPYYSTIWSTGATSNSIMVDSAGTYWVVVNDSICSNSDTITISNLSFNFISINDTSICIDESLTISLPPQNQYLWYNGSTSPNIVIVDSGDYWVEITDMCKIYTDSFSLRTKDCSCPIFIPNVFTPNGDGLNDNFHAVINCDLDFYKMYIFNRWGELVYLSEDQNQAWDAKYKNREVPDGVYFYVMEYIHEYSSSSIQTMNGSVTIFR